MCNRIISKTNQTPVVLSQCHASNCVLCNPASPYFPFVVLHAAIRCIPEHVMDQLCEHRQMFFFCNREFRCKEKNTARKIKYKKKNTTFIQFVSQSVFYFLHLTIYDFCHIFLFFLRSYADDNFGLLRFRIQLTTKCYLTMNFNAVFR